MDFAASAPESEAPGRVWARRGEEEKFRNGDIEDVGYVIDATLGLEEGWLKEESDAQQPLLQILPFQSSSSSLGLGSFPMPRSTQPIWTFS